MGSLSPPAFEEKWEVCL